MTDGSRAGTVARPYDGGQDGDYSPLEGESAIQGRSPPVSRWGDINDGERQYE